MLLRFVTHQEIHPSIAGHMLQVLQYLGGIRNSWPPFSRDRAKPTSVCLDMKAQEIAQGSNWEAETILTPNYKFLRNYCDTS